MSIRIHPWFTADDYAAVRKLVADDPDLPDAYDEWLNLATKRFAEEEARGLAPNKVVVNSDKIARYCRAAGLNHEMPSLHAYALAKFSGYKD